MEIVVFILHGSLEDLVVLSLNMQHSAGYLLGSQMIHKIANIPTDLFLSIPGCNQLF